MIIDTDGLGSMEDENIEWITDVLGSCKSMDGEGWTSIKIEEGNALIIDADALGSMEDNNRVLITDLPGSCKSMDGEGLTSMNEEDSAIEDNNRELMMGICVLSNCESVDD